MSFAAPEWEFRARFWFMMGSYWAGFFLYLVDHQNVSAAIALFVYRHQTGVDAKIDHLIILLFAVGTAFTTLAALIRTWAGAYLHSSVIHDAALHGEQLVADGPYRHLRNPLYLGNIFLATGVGFLASRSGFVVIVVANVIIVYRLIFREEITLLASQGESYRRYYAAVPRLWPSLRPRVPAGGAKPNWADGFSGEMMMWSAAAAMAVFTATQKIGYFWAVFGAGMAIYLLQSYLRERAKKSAAGPSQ
jgi:protein-S-isoprenylcysteine O-methyltransferase Ste14